MIRSSGGTRREEETTPTLARGRFGRLRVHKIGTEENPSDLLTKALKTEKQRKHGREARTARRRIRRRPFVMRHPPFSRAPSWLDDW